MMAQRVAQDAMIQLRVTDTTISTHGETVYAYLISQRSGQIYQVGFTPGAEAGQAIEFTAGLEGLAPGLYHLEVVASPATTNPKTLIPGDGRRPYRVEIYPRKSRQP
jgi:hypothetical protein